MSKMSMEDEILQVGSYRWSSRLLVGTGKYHDHEQGRQAIDASGAQVVTFAVRRTNLTASHGEPGLLDYFPPQEFCLLPNTAGCFDAQSAVRTARLARELLDGHRLIKLEVLGCEKTLYPNVAETLVACEQLVADGFDVMVYTNDDPIVAQQLEQLGCIAIMPLASLIGSGLGICNEYTLSLLIEQAGVPVVVDAGVGTASDATVAMELGCDAVLMNSAIALSSQPVVMARAMRHAVVAGRLAYLAGRMPKRLLASPSSPMEAMVE